MRASLLPRHLRFHRLFSTKKPFPGDEVLVHDEPICSKIDPSKVPPVPHFDKNVIRHLESLSLLRFQDEYAVSTLREAVARANRLLSVDVSNVEPSYTVWEEQDCPLHDDTPEEPLSVKEVLKNATLSYEDYFVTPPGNVPLEESTQPLDISLINEWDERGVAVPPKPRKVEKR